MTTGHISKIMKSIGAILAVLAAAVLAITNVTAPVVYAAGSNPATVLMLRALVTALAITLLLLLGGRMARLALRDELNCIISGILFSLTGVGLLTALAISPVSIVVLILYLYPLLTTLFDAVASRRMPDKFSVALMFVALFGLGLALEAGGQILNSNGIWLALLAAVSIAVTLVWNNHMLAKVYPEQITLRIFCVNFVIFGTYVAYTRDFQLPLSNDGILVMVFLLGCYVVAFSVMFRAVQMAGSVRAAMIMNLEPIISIILSVIILAETINFRQGIGAIIVLATVLISQLIAKDRVIA
jgi:drug/metabolite transporter (DMT)-like permease